MDDVVVDVYESLNDGRIGNLTVLPGCRHGLRCRLRGCAGSSPGLELCRRLRASQQDDTDDEVGLYEAYAATFHRTIISALYAVGSAGLARLRRRARRALLELVGCRIHASIWSSPIP